VCPESTLDSAARRSFIRKAALVSVAAGVAGTLVERVVPESSASSSTCGAFCYVNTNDCVLVGFPTSFNKNCLPFHGACTQALYVANNSGCSKNTFRIDGDDNTLFLAANSKSGAANGTNIVLRTGEAGKGETNRMKISSCGSVGINTCVPSPCSIFSVASGKIILCGPICAAAPGPSDSIHAASSSGVGVLGVSCCGIGVAGTGATGVEASAISCNAVPLVVQGQTFQQADLQHWKLITQGTPLSVVNNNGWLGIGATSAPTTLHVGGSLSAKVVTPSTTYDMGNADFAVLANALSAGFTVTLPPAATAAGMIVFVKKIDSSANAVKVAAKGTDKIETKASEALSKPFKSLTLISDGSANWYVLSNSI